MSRHDAAVDEPLFLDEPEDDAPPTPPQPPSIDELFADENAPAVSANASQASGHASLPPAWRGAGTVSARSDRIRMPLLAALIALGLLIGFTAVAFLR